MNNSSPSIRNDQIITKSGLMIEGMVNTMGDPIHYDLNFYDKGRRVFSYPYPADLEVHDERPLKMNFLTICNSLINLTDYIKRTPLKELCAELGPQYFEWVTDNPEELEALEEECQHILKSNEGCEYYAKTRMF